MKWRLIELESGGAYHNMAIDQAIIEELKENRTEPTIRFYKWSPSAVSIGRFQSMESEVNIERCKTENISYVRRITGGGAVYHDNGGEITYSVIAPEDYFPKSIPQSYEFVCSWIISALGNIGIQAKFAPINDIITDEKKISGNAQTRKDGVLLQHGTILYKLDLEKMFGLLKISNEKISDKLIKSVEERVTCVSKYSDLSQESLYKELAAAFVAGKDYHVAEYTERERKRAEELAKNIYSSVEWNFSR
jgi:lipoate---protein ligase